MSDQPTPLFVNEPTGLMALAFRDFVMFLWDQPEARRAFEEQTSTPALPPQRSGLDAMIDEATGLRDRYQKSFVKWAIETQWGAENQ